MTPPPDPSADTPIGRSYLSVIVVWLITLAALYAFQEYFS